VRFRKPLGDALIYPRGYGYGRSDMITDVFPSLLHAKHNRVIRSYLVDIKMPAFYA
jgi:hypothetical protein